MAVNFGYSKKQGFSISITGTAGGGACAGIGGAFVADVLVTNAPSVTDLNGPSISPGIGGGVGVVGGANYLTNPSGNVQGGSLNVGLGVESTFATPFIVPLNVTTTGTIVGYSSVSGLIGPQ